MAITDNIVAYWKFDESSGNAADATGNGNTATNSGTVAYSSAKINNGAQPDGTTTRKFTLPSGVYSIFSGTNSWTISYWQKVSAQYGTIIEIGDASPPTNTNHCTLWVLSTGDSYYLNVMRSDGSAATVTVSSAITLPESSYYFYVITHDGVNSLTKIYRNTTDITTGGGSDSRSAATAAMGQLCLFDQTGYTGYALTGGLDEMGIWSRVLSSVEISTLYNSGSGIQYPFGATSPSFLTLLGVGT